MREKKKAPPHLCLDKYTCEKNSLTSGSFTYTRLFLRTGKAKTIICIEKMRYQFKLFCFSRYFAPVIDQKKCIFIEHNFQLLGEIKKDVKCFLILEVNKKSMRIMRL